MQNTRAKGKIRQSEWSKILARYNDGESIAGIARAYGCTGPAIRYIIKRTGTLKSESRGERAYASSGSGIPAQQSVRSDPFFAHAGTAVAPLVAEEVSADAMAWAELRKRVTGDVASFLVALDQAMLEVSADGLTSLREATDRLMRSTARTRLEIERLLSRHESVERGRSGRAKAAPMPERERLRVPD